MSRPQRRSQFLEQVRHVIRRKGYSIRTEEAYVSWIKRFILFHNKRHPKEMGPSEVEAFLTHLAVDLNVAPSTQNQALQAILFLYREVLHQPLEVSLDFLRAKRPKRLPTVLTRQEVQRVLDAMHGTPKLVAQLLYGSGLRLLEALRLRGKYNIRTVQELLGHKDVKTTMIYTHVMNRGPYAVRSPLDGP